MKFGKSNRNKEFFTLPEVLVVLVIILVLALVAVPIIRKTRVNAWLASCMHSLRTIATASGHYQIDYRQYPPQPFQNANRLPTTMAEYIENREAFACPVDETPPEDVDIVDSYSDFYVTRTSLADGDSLIAGCPRHDNQTIAVNVFKKGNATRNQLGPLHHSQGENQDRQYSGDVVGTGTTWFPDGSSMTIQTPGLEAEIVESFRLDSGQTYTLIKVPANDAFGRLIFDVIPGSKFEVITPAAIAGVRGTVFMVDIIADKKGRKAADVFVYEGSVAVTESTGKGERLASWGVPIQCEQKKRPFRSPNTPPALPGLATRPGEKPVIQRGNPPWAMGPAPWPGGKAPWAPVADGDDEVQINNGERDDGDLAQNEGGGNNEGGGGVNNGGGNDGENGNDRDNENRGNESDRGDRDRGNGNDRDQGDGEDRDRGNGNDRDRGDGEDRDRGNGNDRDRGDGEDRDRGNGNDRDRGDGEDRDRGNGNDRDRGDGEDRELGDREDRDSDDRDHEHHSDRNRDTHTPDPVPEHHEEKPDTHTPDPVPEHHEEKPDIHTDPVPEHHEEKPDTYTPETPPENGDNSTDNSTNSDGTDSPTNSDEQEECDGTLSDGQIVETVRRGAFRGFFPRNWVRWGLWGLILFFLRLILGF